MREQHGPPRNMKNKKLNSITVHDPLSSCQQRLNTQDILTWHLTKSHKRDGTMEMVLWRCCSEDGAIWRWYNGDGTMEMVQWRWCCGDGAMEMMQHGDEAMGMEQWRWCNGHGAIWVYLEHIHSPSFPQKSVVNHLPHHTILTRRKIYACRRQVPTCRPNTSPMIPKVKKQATFRQTNPLGNGSPNLRHQLRIHGPAIGDALGIGRSTQNMTTASNLLLVTSQYEGGYYDG